MAGLEPFFGKWKFVSADNFEAYVASAGEYILIFVFVNTK